MDNWIELINGPMRSEMLQLEVLFHKMIEALPLITFSAIVIFFSTVVLLAELDCMFLTDKESQTREQHPDSTRDKYSQQSAKYFLNDTNAAA